MLLDGTKKNIILTEGINDFYIFNMFKNDNIDLSFFPSTGAGSIQYNIPIFLSCGRKFMCLYDSDKGGNKWN